MALNLDVYKHITANGLKLTSPSVELGQNSVDKLRETKAALEPLKLIGVDLSVLEKAESALTAADTATSSSVANIASSVSNSLQLAQLGQQVNRLDAMENNQPSSCSNTEAIMSSSNGACDEFFEGICDVAAKAGKAIADFTVGLIDKTQLEATLSSIEKSLKPYLDPLKKHMDKELALLNELNEKMQASALAQTISALWNNPCTKAAIINTLPPEIKRLL